MNKRFSYDNMIKSRSIEPSDIIRTFKLDRCCDFMEEKYNNPRLTQKQICNHLGVTDRTIRRFRNDIQMDSPYRNINNNKKKKPNQKPVDIKNDDTKSDDKNKRINKRIKNTLNNMKGGDISDNHTLTGKELIDQAFDSDRINQKDNTKLITIAKRLVDEY